MKFDQKDGTTRFCLGSAWAWTPEIRSKLEPSQPVKLMMMMVGWLVDFFSPKLYSCRHRKPDKKKENSKGFLLMKEILARNQVEHWKQLSFLSGLWTHKVDVF